MSLALQQTLAASGGAASSSLPIWTFQASDGSDPTTGKFTTDNADPSQVAEIRFNSTSKNFIGAMGQFFFIMGSIVLAGANGRIYSWQITTVNLTTYITVTVGAFLIGDTTAMTGDFACSTEPNSDVIALQINQRANIANVLTNSGIAPIADGTYTVGLGVGSNGTITTVSGIITAVQEAS